MTRKKYKFTGRFDGAYLVSRSGDRYRFIHVFNTATRKMLAIHCVYTILIEFKDGGLEIEVDNEYSYIENVKDIMVI